MALHNKRKLNAAPTSAVESAVHDSDAHTYVFPESSRDQEAVYRTIQTSSSSTATPSRTSPPSAPPGSSPKSSSSWTSLPTRT